MSAGAQGVLASRGIGEQPVLLESRREAQQHWGMQQGAHLSPCIPRESVYIIPHPPGQPLPIPAHAEARTEAFQTHL